MTRRHALLAAAAAQRPTWRMPAEDAPHARTWMAFGAQRSIWGARLLPRVQADVALVARTIAKYEPVTLLARPADRALARQLAGPAVTVLEAPLDDLWIRDTGPTFVVNARRQLGAVDLHFNGWGNKQAHQDDAEVASLLTEETGATSVPIELTGEGGGLEVDGHGSAILTESCFLNDNRNPGLSKQDCQEMLRAAFGIEHVLWLPGLRGQDITDGHTDFYARFVRPGVIAAGLDPDSASPDHAVTREHLRLLKAARDRHGKPYEIVTLTAPARTRPAFATREFAAGYINFYVCNGAVIAPQFGDPPADQHCRATLARLFPGRVIEQLDIDGIAAGGGGIHCATQQEPKP